MIIGEIEHKSITITDNDRNVLAIILDDQIIEHKGYQVHFDIGEFEEVDE